LTLRIEKIFAGRKTKIRQIDVRVNPIIANERGVANELPLAQSLTLRPRDREGANRLLPLSSGGVADLLSPLDQRGGFGITIVLA